MYLWWCRSSDYLVSAFYSCCSHTVLGPRTRMARCSTSQYGFRKDTVYSGFQPFSGWFLALLGKYSDTGGTMTTSINCGLLGAGLGQMLLSKQDKNSERWYMLTFASIPFWWRNLPKLVCSFRRVIRHSPGFVWWFMCLVVWVCMSCGAGDVYIVVRTNTSWAKTSLARWPHYKTYYSLWLIDMHTHRPLVWCVYWFVEF